MSAKPSKASAKLPGLNGSRLAGGRVLSIDAAEGGKLRLRFARAGEGITGRGYEVSRNTGRIFKDGEPTEHIMTPAGPTLAPLDELPHQPSYQPPAPMPEAPETLQAQVEAMKAGRRAVVNVTPDALCRRAMPLYRRTAARR